MSTPSRQASFILVCLFVLTAVLYAQQPAPVPVGTPVPVSVPVGATIQLIEPQQAVAFVNNWIIALTAIIATVAGFVVWLIGKIGEMRLAQADVNARLAAHSVKINDIALATQPTTTTTAVNPPENTH